MSPPALSGTAGHERGYLRPRTAMSASTGGDTCARRRRYHWTNTKSSNSYSSTSKIYANLHEARHAQRLKYEKSYLLLQEKHYLCNK